MTPPEPYLALTPDLFLRLQTIPPAAKTLFIALITQAMTNPAPSYDLSIIAEAANLSQTSKYRAIKALKALNLIKPNLKTRNLNSYLINKKLVLIGHE